MKDDQWKKKKTRTTSKFYQNFLASKAECYATHHVNIAQPTINHLRNLKTIVSEGTDKLNIIAKIDGAITELENHFDTQHAEVQDV